MSEVWRREVDTKMKEYHKINTIFKRDLTTKKILVGQYSTPEIEYLANCEWRFDEKIDGTNIRVMWTRESGVRFGGKTDHAQIYVPLIDRLNQIFSSDKFIEAFNGDPPESACLYGEGYGARIQKGGGNYIPDGVDFILFDIRVGDWWLKREDVCDIANKLGLRVVPEVGFGTLSTAIDVVMDGLKSKFGDFEAEGIVARPILELKSRNGHRIITKIKGRDFKK